MIDFICIVLAIVSGCLLVMKLYVTGINILAFKEDAEAENRADEIFRIILVFIIAISVACITCF